MLADFIPAIAGAISTTIAQGRSVDELGILAALFTQLGQSLTYVAALRAIEERITAPQEEKGA